jgi:hypothetical protein
MKALTALIGKVFKWPENLEFPADQLAFRAVARRLVPPPGIELGSTV